MTEIDQTEESVNVYRGVGKMWFKQIPCVPSFLNFDKKGS